MSSRELRIGEHLQDEHGRAVRVTSIIPRGPPQAVYNLEVHGEHVYRVTTNGLLVHNTKAVAVKNGLGRLKQGGCTGLGFWGRFGWGPADVGRGAVEA